MQRLPVVPVHALRHGIHGAGPLSMARWLLAIRCCSPHSEVGADCAVVVLLVLQIHIRCDAGSRGQECATTSLAAAQAPIVIIIIIIIIIDDVVTLSVVDALLSRRVGSR